MIYPEEIQQGVSQRINIPVQYTLSSDITSSLKALKNKTGVGSKSIYSPNWLSQIYNDINMYSDDNILAKIFQTSYNNNSVALNDLGYTTNTSLDYYSMDKVLDLESPHQCSSTSLYRCFR